MTWPRLRDYLLCAIDDSTNLNPNKVKPLRLVRSPGGDFRVDPSTSSPTSTLSTAPSWANRPAAAPAPRPAGRAELQVSVSSVDEIDAPPYNPSHPATVPDYVVPGLDVNLPDEEDSTLALLTPLPMECGCCCHPHHAFTSHHFF